MFESIVEALQSELLSAFPPDRSYRLAELKGDLLPEPVGRYAADALRAAAEAEMASVRPHDLQWVEHDEEAEVAFDRYADACLGAAAVPADEWPGFLAAAIEEAVEHTLRPRAGLVGAVFSGSDQSLEHDEVVARISNYHVGLPLRAAVVRELKNSGSSKLDRQAFRRLVDRVHEDLTASFGRDDWRRELQPPLSLLSAAGITGAIPAETASVWIEDVGGSMPASEPGSTMTAREILDALAGPEPAAESPQATLFETSEATPQPRAPEAVPLWQRFQQNLNEPIASAAQPLSAAAQTPRRTVERIVIDEESQRPLWQKFRAEQAPDNAPEVTTTDMETLVLGPEARSRVAFIASLFGGDEATYFEVLAKLQRSGTWSEASRIIAEQVFKRFQVNIYSEEAVAFTNAVEARFRIREPGD